MCILELSKVLMYKFHYDYIKNKYDNKSKLLFTYTDSLVHEIKTENVYEDFSSDKDWNICQIQIAFQCLQTRSFYFH